jgi:thymidylate kinase
MLGDAMPVIAQANMPEPARRPAPGLDKYAVVAGIAAMAAFFVWQGASSGLIDDALAAVLLLVAAIIVIGWPVLDVKDTDLSMAPLVALVGCDGSGKTTLSTDLLTELGKDRRTALCYLGLGSGTMGEKLKTWPLIGRVLERKLAGKAKQARTRGEKIPGLPTAIVLYAFSLARLRRFRRMLAMRRDGVTVITDRYPQIEVPGFYDGPGLSAARADNRLVAALARRERRMYDWMASFRPDVVIRLNVDLDTAFARKPDHKYELLRQKVDATARLLFSGARIVDLDSRQAYPEVRAQAEAVLRQTLSA